MADAVCPADDALSASCVLLPVVCEPHAERRMHAQVMSAVILLIFNYYLAAGNGSLSFLPVLPGFLFFIAQYSNTKSDIYRRRRHKGYQLSLTSDPASGTRSINYRAKLIVSFHLEFAMS